MNIKSLTIAKCADCPLITCEHSHASGIPDDCPLPDHITQVHARIANEAWTMTQQLNQALRESATCSVCGNQLTPYRRGTCDDCLVEFSPEIIQMARDCIDKSHDRKTNMGTYNNDALALIPDLITIAHEVVRFSGSGE